MGNPVRTIGLEDDNQNQKTPESESITDLSPEALSDTSPEKESQIIHGHRSEKGKEKGEDKEKQPSGVTSITQEEQPLSDKLQDKTDKEMVDEEIDEKADKITTLAGDEEKEAREGFKNEINRV